MAVLGTIIDQQQDTGRGKTFAQKREKRLRLIVQLVQIFEDEEQRLIETLACQ